MVQLNYPDEPEVRALEGELHLADGDVNAAIASYEAAVDLRPTRLHAIRAFLLRRDHDKATPHLPLMNYLEARPLDADVRNALAQHFMQNDDNAAAIEQLESIVSSNPGNVTAMNNLAGKYNQVGDRRAVATARRAYNLQPENGAVVDTLGWILVEHGEYGEGEELLRTATTLTGGRPTVRYHHAVALAKLGRNAEAVTVLENLLGSEQTFSERRSAEELLASL